MSKATARQLARREALVKPSIPLNNSTMSKSRSLPWYWGSCSIVSTVYLENRINAPNTNEEHFMVSGIWAEAQFPVSGFMKFEKS